MQIRSILYSLLIFAALTAIPSSAAEPPDIAKTLDRILRAYNAADAKTFWEGASRQVSDFSRAADLFQFRYIEGPQATYGKYVSRVFREQESAITDDFAVLIYQTKCQKRPATLVVNMTKEDGEYRLVTLEFEDP